jgi:hypothetical protein
MNTISPRKVALVLALFLGLWHAFWVILVAAGFAQPLMDFIFRMHFIKPIFVIEAFEPLRALGLIGITTVLGYVLGFVLGLIWNALHK